ncbi:MAG: oligoendopeptidase F [Blastochloris sp.]|nr:oligoendopeptidase F [Blastochloris sp.]
MRFLDSNPASAPTPNPSPLLPPGGRHLETSTDFMWTIAAWDRDLASYAKRFPKYLDFKGTLHQSAAQLQRCLEFDRELDLIAERLGHYASLRSSEDSSSEANLARESRFQHVMIQAAELAAFLTPEIQSIPDESFAQFLSEPSLAEWTIKLQKLRRYKPHVLSENEERLLAMVSLPLSGIQETFSQLTNVDMNFGVIKDDKGQERELSHGLFSSFLVKSDPELRRRAFHQYYEEFQAHRYTLASSLIHSVKTDVFQAKARHHTSAREASLFSDHVPVSVYDNLIETVHAHLAPLHEYYELRKEVLKLKELHFYDTYVPITARMEQQTSFDVACEKVVAALHPLGDEYTDTLASGFRDRWVDRYESKGKRSGAFSSSSYGNPPYILMNYKEDVFSDVYTLAHEAGHSMHTWYSQREQRFQDYHYPIFLAEVASTFNEELLTHDLLEKTDDPRMRAYIINRQVDDIRATLIRQTMFAEFEKLIHTMDEAGEPLTLESLRSVYRALLERYHGPDMVIDEVLELECLRIPHFYSAFYVYKYATGISASLALSQQVLAGGEAERTRYLAFLKSGGSRYPLETLQLAGVDMSSPQPVAQALQLFAQRVRELKELL